MMYSNDFSASLEQRNHANNFCANPEQSTHVNSSASSCCQPLKHHGRHGEPLYKSLLRPHQCSPSPLMDYVERTHHRHHHECTLEAETSAVSNCFPHQFTDCISCRFGFSNLDENNTSRGSITKGQNYYSFRAQSNEITLYNWYLIRSGGSHSSEIAVGGFLSNRGMENERIETSTIVKRLEECKVLTKDGNVVNLVGPIDDYRTVSNGFSLQTVHLFISGFPHIWNLVVGLGLPAKGAEANQSTRSCDFYNGEVTSQVSLQKDFKIQGNCMHRSASEGRINEMASCPEAQRPHALVFATEKGSEEVEAAAEIPEQEQGNALLNGKPQSSGDQLPSIVQVHEQQDRCVTAAGAGSDKEPGLPKDFVKEKCEHEASHGQMQCTAKQVESRGPTCEIENMPTESAEAVVTESRSEDNEPDCVTKVSSRNNTLVESQDKKSFLEARADANKPVDLDCNARTNELSDEKLELPSVQSLEASDCCRESRMAKISKHPHGSLSRKRKVNFNLPHDVETEHQSYTSLNLETSTKKLGRSCSLNSKGTEQAFFAKSIAAEKNIIIQTVTTKQKGKRKKKGSFSLPKYNRSTRSTVNFNIYEDTDDGKGAKEGCNEESLEAGCKRRKSIARNRNSTEGQSGASLSEPSSPNKTAERKSSITAVVLEPIKDRIVKSQQGVNEKFHVKKAAEKKIVAKRGKGCLAKLQATLKGARVYNDPSQTENNNLVSSMIESQKAAKIKDSIKGRGRKRQSGDDPDIHLGTSEPRRLKTLKKMKTRDLKDSTCREETSEGHCIKQAYTDCDSGLATMASPRKRLKQILPPPLPLPLVSVSKQLISKAFGLKTSRSGRLLVPPLAHWRGQSLVRDLDGGIIAIEDGSEDALTEDTGRFTFKAPVEARAKKLQKWLCETATECLTKKFKARKKASSVKRKQVSN